MSRENLDITSIPTKVSQFIDEEDMSRFIQEALMEQGTIIGSEDAQEVTEVAFDYIVMKLSQDIQSTE